MQLTLIVVSALHVLSAVFWGGSTFAAARVAGAGAGRLFLPQMGAAVVVVISGALLWRLLHDGSFGTAEQILAVGAFCALAAAGVQATLIGPVWRKLGGTDVHDMRPVVRRVATAQRIAAALLAIAVVCMAVVRFA